MSLEASWQSWMASICVCAPVDAGLSRERKVVLKAMAANLQQRPIWSHAELAELDPLTPMPELDMILPRLAYIFRNGELSTAQHGATGRGHACIVKF